MGGRLVPGGRAAVLSGVVAVSTIFSGTGLSGQSELREYAVDAAASEIYVVTHKRGLLSFLGHEHAILPLSWEGTLCVSDPVADRSRGSLVIRTGSLVIDSDSARALAGLGGGPGEETIRSLQTKMLDASHLAATTYPEVRLEVVALGVEGEGRGLRTRAAVTLRGVTRKLELPVTVEPGVGGELRLGGVLTLRQSDFGITPESIAGVVKVSDPVDLHFLLVARPTGGTCDAPRGASAGSQGLPG